MSGAVAAAALLALAGARAEATTITQIQLAGGGKSDGLALNSNGNTVVNAFYADAGGTDTPALFQGVSFTPFQNSTYLDSGVGTFSNEGPPTNVAVTYTGSNTPEFYQTRTADTYANAFFTSTDTTDSNALVALANEGFLFVSSATPTAGTLTITYSNLTPGGSYSVDLLSSCLGYGTKSYTVTANGVTSGTLSEPTSNEIYDDNISGLTPTNGSNQIVVSMTYAGASNGALFNAAALSLSSVPEPASVSLLGLGSLALLARRRRSHANR